MCWPPRVSTRIHGHPGDGCVHNLLEGKLVETLYHGEDSVGKYHTILPGKGSVFINDDIGFHKVHMHYFVVIDRGRSSRSSLFFPPLHI